MDTCLALVKTIAEVCGIVALGTSAIWGLYEFRLKRIAERKKLAFEIFEKFKLNPECALAAKMLDWDTKLNIASIGEKPMFVRSSTQFLGMALMTEKPMGFAGFSKEEERARDIFDTFFTELEVISGHVQAAQVLDADLKPFLGYWADLIVSGQGHHGTALSNQALAFLKAYRFSGALALLTRMAAAAKSS